MKEEIKVPSVGESVTQGMLAAWLKEPGQPVREGEDLFELETDKATVTVPAPTTGMLEIKVEGGSEVSIGQVVGVLDTQGVASASAPATVADNSVSGAVHPIAETDKSLSGAAPTANTPISAAVEAPGLDRLSPAVRRIVKEHDLDPRGIVGTGKDGRITKADALTAVQSSDRTPGVVSGEAPVIPQPAPSPGERQTRVPMTGIRKAIASRLLQATQNSACLTTFNEVNMEKVMGLRSSYRESFEKSYGVKLGFMSFFVRACCQALEQFPAVNAMIQGNDIVYHHFYDIGVAVSTERGLLVPVIRGADALSFAEIERAIADLARRAREKKITPDELSGGTFTITNGGIYGSLLSTPIPNYPQTAILGMHAIQKRPVAVEGQVEVKPMMYLALSYDHRLIDGREAVQFLVAVKQKVEDPQRLLLAV